MARDRADLARTLTWKDGLAAFLAAALGPGLLAAALPAARVLGPAGPLGFLAALPLAVAVAVPFAVYLSGPLGTEPGGVYRHVAHTWDAPLAGFVVGWLALGSYLAIAAEVALAFGRVLAGVAPLAALPASAWAVAVLAALVAVQIAGTDLFGWSTTAAVALLLGLLAVLLGVGALAADPAAFRPPFPGQLYGSSFAGRLLAGLSTFLVAYVGLDVVAQTAGEARNPRRTLPRVVLAGVPITLGVHAAVSAVVLGVVPWWQLVEVSRQPLADAARTFLPGRTLWLVAVVAALTAATTASAALYAASRLIVAFGRDRLVPAFAAGVRGDSRTPAASLLIPWAVVAALVVSGAADFAAELAVAGLAVAYVAHSLSAAALAVVAPSLYDGSRIRPSAVTLAVCGIVGAVAVGTVAWHAADPGSAPAALGEFGEGSAREALATSPALGLVAWVVVGSVVAVRYRAYLDGRGVDLDAPDDRVLAERYDGRETTDPDRRE